jgi:hypothetical protein
MKRMAKTPYHESHGAEDDDAPHAIRQAQQAANDRW